MAYNLAYDVIQFAVFVFMVFVVLRIGDLGLGIKFSDRKDQLGDAYYGLRYLGTCLIAALAIVV